MDWERAIRTEREMLKRILALYLHLAGLADRACGRSRPVRWLVLWALRPAEACALQRIAEVEPWLYAALAQPRSDGRSEARRVARCFRAAARAVKKLLQTMARCQTPSATANSDRPTHQPALRGTLFRAFSAVQSFIAGTALRWVQRFDTS